MTQKKVRLITQPTVIALAEQRLNTDGLNELLDWVKDYRPECVPDDLPAGAEERAMALFPHHGIETAEFTSGGHTTTLERHLSHNELLTELAGRECYHSYGLKAGRKDNREYIARMFFPEDPAMLPHASVGYHAKMSFFLAGISRRVSHELIRHYVGADRTEEGSPSQESTRYTFHPGHFAVPPYVIEQKENGWDEAISSFEESMQAAYNDYLKFISDEEDAHAEDNHGMKPTGIDRKRIYECAAGLLPMQACTSMIWTTNPLALGKLFKERCSEAADKEFQRFANRWREISVARWPNLLR